MAAPILEYTDKNTDYNLLKNLTLLHVQHDKISPLHQALGPVRIGVFFFWFSVRILEHHSDREEPEPKIRLLLRSQGLCFVHIPHKQIN